MDSAVCRSCGANILWARTSNGKAMPLDATPNPKGNLVVDGKGCIGAATKGELPDGEVRYISHFATCPNSAKHRKRA